MAPRTRNQNKSISKTILISLVGILITSILGWATWVTKCAFCQTNALANVSDIKEEVNVTIEEHRNDVCDKLEKIKKDYTALDNNISNSNIELSNKINESNIQLSEKISNSNIELSNKINETHNKMTDKISENYKELSEKIDSKTSNIYQLLLNIEKKITKLNFIL